MVTHSIVTDVSIDKSMDTSDRQDQSARRGSDVEEEDTSTLRRRIQVSYEARTTSTARTPSI